MDKWNADQCDIIEGRNPIMEVLKSDREIYRILVAEGLRGAGKKAADLAKRKGIKVDHVDKSELDRISLTGAHQGIIALVSKYRYIEGVDRIVEKAREKGENPLVIVLDKLKDPHNLGAIIRTAHCCGAHGIVIPKRNAAGITPAAIKASAGAVEYMPVARVTNIARTLEEMKDMGLWIAGADMDGELMYRVDLTGPIALVIGSEGKGISRLVKEKCDFIVRIPMKGELSSLNASVAAGVLMYEILRQREK